MASKKQKQMIQHEEHDGVHFLRETGGGVYCITPYYNAAGEEETTMFKVGNALSFQGRLGQYHTVFINGVAFAALLKINPKAKEPKTKAALEEYRSAWVKVLNAVENDVLQRLRKMGSIILKNNLRVRKQGQSEWVFSNMDSIHAAFDFVYEQAKKTYGKLYNISLKKFPLDIAGWKQALAGKRVFKAEILYNLDNDSYLPRPT